MASYKEFKELSQQKEAAKRRGAKKKSRNKAPAKQDDFDISRIPEPTPYKKPSPRYLVVKKQAFGAAFKEARKAGKKEFTWQGKKYHTRTKEEEAKRKEKVAPKPKPKAKAKPTAVKEKEAAPEVKKKAVKKKNILSRIGKSLKIKKTDRKFSGRTKSYRNR